MKKLLFFVMLFVLLNGCETPNLQSNIISDSEQRVILTRLSEYLNFPFDIMNMQKEGSRIEVLVMSIPATPGGHYCVTFENGVIVDVVGGK